MLSCPVVTYRSICHACTTVLCAGHALILHVMHRDFLIYQSGNAFTVVAAQYLLQGVREAFSFLASCPVQYALGMFGPL